MNVNNLTNLLEIDKEHIINILKTRYDNNQIYTNIDDILIAINPYKKLPIYDYNSIQHPHIYNIAKKSINNLKSTNKNQTILISGRSGSGKTMSTKFIINYFAHHFSSNQELCQQIINANPIIEMFGNAQTPMNDNSSRFGKFIKVYFNDNVSEITGIQIDTYLLEKSRVCYQNNNDFNFHIFNQVAQKLGKSYKYCRKQENFQTLDDTIDMMLNFGFHHNEIHDIIKIIELILQIGQYNGENEIKWEEYIDLKNFGDLISKQILKAGNEKIIKTLTGEALEKNKFTIATQLYEICFHYVINKINMILNPNSTEDKFIGLLDIFGFEIFDQNNFEQLCINYTNEKLQNYHNYIIFQHEQALYKKEGINWKVVDYKDNSKILDIFEDKSGIINLLDEECTLVHSSDNNFYLKMQNRINNPYIISKRDPHFIIHHYAGDVEYRSTNFCEKNKQKITRELLSFISHSDNIIFKNTSKKLSKTKSIIKDFSKELNILINKIKKTNSLFIKCIKPNSLQISDNYDMELIYTQLLFSGIFEIIEISRSNYPIRYPIVEFYKKYDYIMNEFKTQKFGLKDIQFGNTIVFMRAETYKFLEDELLKYKNNCAILIQSNWKRYYMQKLYQTMKEAIIKIQAQVRMFLEKRRYQEKRRKIIMIQSYVKMVQVRREYLDKIRMIIKIQSIIRAKIEQKKYKETQVAVIKIQSVWRMYRVRKKYLLLRTKVTLFQRLWREKKLRKEDKNRTFEIKLPSIYWPKSNFDSPSAFYITNEDLIIEDNDEEDEELLSTPSTPEEEKEIDILKQEYENKLETMEKKYTEQKMKKEHIKEKFKKKLQIYEKQNELLNETLTESQETNKMLVERLNNLLIANYKLQEKIKIEKRKGVLNKLYDFLFT